MALVGRVLIAVGLLMFGFVAYQLWGTGIQYAQAQDRLDDEFAELLANAPTTTMAATTTVPATTPSVNATTPPALSTEPATTEPPTPTTTATTAAAAPPPISLGDAIARIESPAIGLDAIVVAGVSTDDLQDGPGHYPDTRLPGQLGNAAIAGHRTTFGQPFYRIDELRPGDEIVVTTVAGGYVYRVTGTQIVSPSDSHVIATTDPTAATLTLTSCHPRYTARDRIVVSAALDDTASPEPAPPTPSYAADDEPGVTTVPTATGGTRPTVGTAPTGGTAPTIGTAPTSAPTTAAPSSSVVAPPTDADAEPVGDAFDQGWFDDDAAFGQVALWGFALTGISIGSYALSRAVRTNWAGGLAGVVPFVVCLYFFFQNVNRLLPAAI